MLGNLALAVFGQCLPAVSVFFIVHIRCVLRGTADVGMFVHVNLLAIRKGRAVRPARLEPAFLAQQLGRPTQHGLSALEAPSGWQPVLLG
jgi:hypothetical protein